ncbi:hypothetical protein AALO_G00097640 [Alosa alosa]|uniref:Transposase n=1 Tax=Alosa alosa TaxID=278164 RepID=A0AAV6GUZ9_9TELE|nr:hypothetical protein AALO_G00097640 [Alosa alosa]
MKGALDEYREGVKTGIPVSVHLLSRAWGVPRSTLQRRISGKVTGSKHVSGRKPYLPQEAERELAATLKTLAQRGFPFTKRDVQQVAFDFAAKNQISGFSKTAGRAGYYWFHNFLKRNPELGMRKPEVLSAARAAGLNKVVVNQWFTQYESLLVELGIAGTPSHIWNCDESGLQDQFSSTKVVGQVGQPCVEVCAGEKGETTTCLAAFNAEGIYSRTMIIFKGKRVRSEWLQGCPENTSVRCSDNGWITSDLFLEWGQMFIQSLPKDDPRPHLLLLDGHSSHVYNMEFIKLLKSKNVHIMCYPAHTTHALQPADKALFKSLKHHWDQEGRKWTRMMAGQKLSRMEFFTVFSRAWAKAATVENAQAGFRGTGMFPLNKDILPETAFAPSKTTERVLPSTLPSSPTRPQSLPTPPTGPWSPLLTLTHSARQPSALLSGHQSSHPPARPQSPADPPARPQSSASLTPLLPVEPLYFFPDEKVVFEEVVLEEVPEEDNDIFNQFTPQEETHSPDEGPSTSTSVTFTDLITVPQRERAIRKRMKPPSYNLSSEEHIDYITKKTSSKKPAKQASKCPLSKQPKGKRKQEKKSKSPCKVCNTHYGDPEDPKATEEWVKCDPCSAWFHETCGEENGICADDGFICKDCL